MGTRTLLWAMVPLLGMILPSMGRAQIIPDTSAVIVLAANHTDDFYELYVTTDSTYSHVGESRPNTGMIWVLPSRYLGSGARCIILWMRAGTHAMVADTLTRRPGIVNVYRREFGSVKTEPRQS